MFPRGPRFNPTKVSDVPAPNAYNPQDPGLDSYKRGAFLEKSDRFAKPVENKLAALQNKVDNLERVHQEEKKSHQLEVERLKLDLARLQKQNSDLLKKHSDSADSRIHNLKKAAAADAAELKTLRQKLISKDDLQAANESQLLAQLEHHRQLLASAAHHYALLAATTVPRDVHHTLKLKLAAAQLRICRLERKLANADDQVIELAHLIRHVKQENINLHSHLQTALDENAFLASIDHSQPIPEDTSSLHLSLAALQHYSTTTALEDLHIRHRDALLTADFYTLKADACTSALSVLHKDLTVAEDSIQNHAQDLASALASHEAIAALLESTQKARSAAETNARELEAQVSQLTSQATDLTQTARDADARLKKEQNIVHHLTTTVQTSRMAEDALRADIESLTSALMDAEPYQAAYTALSDEIALLAARNDIAEGEAARLSSFNAQLIGHQNPAQKIMYVDRVRRELADAKYQIAQLTREREAAAATNAGLQHELEMYTSVMVAPAHKPRTAITRVARVPLANLARSINVEPLNTIAHSHKNNMHSYTPISTDDQLRTHLPNISDEMTIDEII